MKTVPKLADGQQELIRELRLRFPLIEKFTGQFGKDVQKEQIPWFFALLLSAATKQGTGASCFVLDKTQGTTAIAAILQALFILQNKFQKLVNIYAKEALTPGQNVKVKPNDYVYEYRGLWKGKPKNRFRLKVMDEETYFTFPINQILRLEPTNRIRPKGLVKSDLGKYERSRLDELLGLTTCGNNSLIQNTVLLYMAQARFLEIMNAITLTSEHGNGFHSLSTFLPWGPIGQDGKLKSNDTYQVVGEPIIAVTRVPEDLALASSLATVATKIVFVDGARGLARDIQAFDDIANRQRVVILASSEETEALGLLKDRGCPIWHMSPDEIMIGEASTNSRVRESLVGATIQAADTRQSARVTILPCQDSTLEAVAASLEYAATIIDGGEEIEESEKILRRLYGVLLECSECCFGVGEETKNNLKDVQAELLNYERWLDQEFVRIVQESSCQLENIITSRSHGQEKANALLDFFLDDTHKSWVVGARSYRTSTNLQAEFRDLGINVCILPIDAITPDRGYEGIIVPSWPNERRFTRLKAQAVTRDVRVLAYPFEAKWVSRHQVRERMWKKSNRMEVEERAAILGIEPHLLSCLKHHESDSLVSKDEPDLPIFRLEDRVTHRSIARPRVAADGEDSREAQLVQFFGDCHTLLTKWAELPRLNQLTNGTSTNGAKLTHRTVSQLSPGDIVLFRASGDKEFIRLIAEDMLGTEEYERVRIVAERWKFPLRHLGTSPHDVQRHLAARGLSRTTATIGRWLSSPDCIGPRNFRDIEFIARATGDSELLSIRKDVEEAITRIRGTHISAGSQLTQFLLSELYERFNQLDERPVLLDLGYGEAWVVQVKMVEEKRQKYPSNLVNRLLWADDIGF